MRKDPSTLVTEFIQGGSLGDDNTNTNTDINSLDNLTPVGDCVSTNNAIRKDLDRSKREQRDSNNEESLPILNSLSFSSSSSETEEEEAVSATVATASSEAKKIPTKSVRFGACSVRSYNQILGDHPLCVVGCPLALGWRVVREEGFTVEDYEAIREPLRKKKGAKSPTNQRRRKRVSLGDEPHMEPTLKYINSQLRLTAHERRERLQEYSDAQIRREWSMIQKQPKKSLVKEGLRQFRAASMHYAGF